ncbi:MAG TPA: glycosyltransferase, partial [Spirochaetota bacterium]|nr:glycosyltransferase [Spirochaetota bacterium]
CWGFLILSDVVTENMTTDTITSFKGKDMNLKKILYYTIGPEIMPSSRARVYIYKKYLTESGINVRIIPAIGIKSCEFRIKKINTGIRKMFFAFDAALRLVFFVISSLFYNTIIIQKILFPVKIIPLMKIIFRNKNMIFDIDDVIFISHQNDAVKDEDNLQKKYSKNMELYGRIFTSTPFLNKMIEERFGIDSSRIVAVTDPIDTDVYKSSGRTNREITIGWIGTPSNTIYLEECLEDLLKLHDEGYAFRLFFCGADRNYINNLVENRIDCVYENWSLENEPAIYDNLDIGIMPLPDDVWSKGKGGYKLMLYMAMEKIAVASSVGINGIIANDSTNSFLLEPGESWYKKIKYVLDNYGNLALVRNAARIKICSDYSLKKTAPLYLKSISL